MGALKRVLKSIKISKRYRKLFLQGTVKAFALLDVNSAYNNSLHYGRYRFPQLVPYHRLKNNLPQSAPNHSLGLYLRLPHFFHLPYANALHINGKCKSK